MMSDLHRSLMNFSHIDYGDSGNNAPSNATVPSTNIQGLMRTSANPINESFGRSLEIKRQLRLSFHSHSVGTGVIKPRSRKSSVHYVKSEDDGGHMKGNSHSYGKSKDNDNEEGKEDQEIERKRRDNINEKIQELLLLIPADYFQEPAAKEGSPVPGNLSSGVSANAKANPGAALSAITGAEANQTCEDALALSKAAGTRDGNPNKGQILTQAVEYIQHLQNLIDENNRREVELFLKLKTLEKSASGRNPAAANVPIAVEATSAEKALGEIGVGPESEHYFQRVLLESLKASKSEN